MFKKKVALTSTKPIPITSAMLIERANLVVNNAINMFSNAVKEVESANEMLEDSKKKSQEEIESLKVNLERKEKEKLTAEDSIKANNALKEKLSQFIV